MNCAGFERREKNPLLQYTMFFYNPRVDFFGLAMLRINEECNDNEQCLCCLEIVVQ